MKLIIRNEDMAEFLGQFIDVFDDLLEERGVRIPTSDAEMEENDELEGNEARIYGSDYSELEENIRELLDNWGNQEKKKNTNRINIRKDRYVVQNNDGEDAWLSIMTADEIIESVSMSDCSGISVEVWEQTGLGELSKLTVKGTWHADDPLLIEAFREDGTVAFAGHGIDH